jgi:hypothetical protein
MRKPAANFLLLSGGWHVSPVALLYNGNIRQVAGVLQVEVDSSIPVEKDPEIPATRSATRAPSPSNNFHGRCELAPLPSRAYLEVEEIAPEAAACVTVNGQYAGGFIGKPFRLDVTRYLKADANRIDITPFAPKSVRLNCQ